MSHKVRFHGCSWLFSVLTLFVSLLISVVNAEEITVAVASNFTASMKTIVRQFENNSGHKVKLVFGSSGKFYAQIINGAPFQAFLSADQAKPIALEKEKLILENSRFTYATGRLALWSTAINVADLRSLALSQGRYNKLALANSKLAPYGRAAEETLSNLLLLEQTKDKWVKGENISQTYQFVSTENTDLGFVALSQIMKDKHIIKGSAWIVPEHLHQPIKQDAVILLAGKNSSATIELMQFMNSEEAKLIIKSHGYHVL